MARSSCLMLPVIPLVAALCGCGDSLNVAEVEGVVKLNGQPLDRIQVEFWPVGAGVRSVGTTDSSGRFKLMTDDGTREGAVVGSHKVVLHDAGALGDKFLGALVKRRIWRKGRSAHLRAILESGEDHTDRGSSLRPEKRGQSGRVGHRFGPVVDGARALTLSRRGTLYEMTVRHSATVSVGCDKLAVRSVTIRQT